MMEHDFLQGMYDEYGAIGGFCVRLRSERFWDKEAFERLVNAMRACCKYYEIPLQERERERQRVWLLSDEELKREGLIVPSEPRRLLPDWIALIFWFVPRFVKDWTSHSSWNEEREREPQYFQKAYQRLDGLATWFFEGHCLWTDEERWWEATTINS